MPLFSEYDRMGDDGSLKSRSESIYEYTNRSNRAEAYRVRKLLDDWFDRFPNGQAKDGLKARITSKEVRVHYAAVFELALFAFFQAIGLRITVEPPVGGKQPDFHVEDNSGNRCIIEATTSFEISDDEYARLQIGEETFAYINDHLISDNFSLDIEFPSWPKNTPKNSKIVEFIKKRIDDIDYNEVYQQSKDQPKLGLDNAPEFAVPQWMGFPMSIKLLHRNPARRGLSTNLPIGYVSQPPHRVDYETQIRKKLKRKTGYDTDDMPYIIAINFLSQDLLNKLGSQRIDLLDVLLPEVGSSIAIGKDEKDNLLFNERVVPGRDGFFTSENNTSVSGVLFVLRLSAFGLAGIDSGVIPNPWAKHKLPTWVNKLDVMQSDRKTFEKRKSRRMQEILHIPEGWPETDRTDRR